MKIIKKILFIIVLFFPLNLYSDTNKNKTIESKNKNKTDSGFVPFIIPFYSPETGWGVGGTILYYNDTNFNGNNSRLNEIQVYGAATENYQKAAGLKTERYYNNESYKLKAQIEADKWPDKFWGIGPNVKKDNEEDYTDSTLYINISLMRKIINNVYIGPLYRYRKIKMDKKENDGLLSSDEILGNDGKITSGPGIVFNWDKRDKIYFPLNGFNFETIASSYLKQLGSEYNYYKFEFNHRHFIQLYNYHVIAFQVKTQFSHGDVPFQSLYKMGGREIMRGIYSGRYRDKNHIALQTEYRFPILWRFGGVIFGSMSQVAPEIKDFNDDNIIYAWGFGLRFIADKKKHINFSLDVGFNNNYEESIYLTVKEAF